MVWVGNNDFSLTARNTNDSFLIPHYTAEQCAPCTGQCRDGVFNLVRSSGIIPRNRSALLCSLTGSVCQLCSYSVPAPIGYSKILAQIGLPVQLHMYHEENCPEEDNKQKCRRKDFEHDMSQLLKAT